MFRSKMSLQAEMGRLHDITVDEALQVLRIIRDAVKASLWFRSWWKAANPFKRYRVVQIPVEILYVALVFGVLAAGGILYSSLIGFVIAVPIMFLGEKVKSGLLRRLREKLVLPDPII